MESPRPLRVCYMGIADASFSRTNIYLKLLRARGVVVSECFDMSPGFRKFVQLFKKHRALRGEYDVLIVGYPSYIAVPFAHLISRKPILFDAGWSLYEGMVVSRGRSNSLARLYYWLIDKISYLCADFVLLETESQVEFYTKLLRGKTSKCRRLFTGTDETLFFHDPSIKKREIFTVLFRGKHTAEAGLPCVIEAARLLEREGIQFLIISPGFEAEDIPRNVTILSTSRLEASDLRKRMQECHVSLGQCSSHERLERTIPHKAFESIAMHIPFVAARARGIEELLEDGKSTLLFEGGSGEDLARKIRILANDLSLRAEIADRAFEAYRTKCSGDVLGRELEEILGSLAAQ